MEIDLNFPEMPPAIVQQPHRKPLQARRYHHKEAIHLKELRTVFSSSPSPRVLPWGASLVFL